MNKDDSIDVDDPKKRNVLTTVIVGLCGVVSLIYLLNPTAGLIELIPDGIPIFGNLDEAAAAGILISCLAYFGLDVGALFGRKEKSEDKDNGVIDVEVEE